jgi:hypothetical protein
VDIDYDWQHDYPDIEYMIDNLVSFDRDKIHHYDQHMMEQNHTNFFQHHNLINNDLGDTMKSKISLKICRLHLLKHCRRPSHFTFLYGKHVRVCTSKEFGCVHV